jgi:hypothetical protein
VPNKPRESVRAQRLAAAGPGFVDTFLRDNKVIPPVLAVLALLIFSWIVAGAFIGTPEKEPVSNQAVVAQSDDEGGTGTPAPETENRDVDSYAAYRSKDPFRQLLPTAESTTGTGAATVPDDTGTGIGTDTGIGGTGATGGGGAGGGTATGTGTGAGTGAGGATGTDAGGVANGGPAGSAAGGGGGRGGAGDQSAYPGGGGGSGGGGLFDSGGNVR